MNELVTTSDMTAALEQAHDPGEFVVMALERGKSWLAEALAHGDLDALVNVKGYAETLRVATVQKQLGHDAVLSATELVRRAERCIGLGIRAGQEAGEIRSSVHSDGGPRTDYEKENGQHVHVDRVGDTNAISSPTQFVPEPRERIDIYRLTDNVSDEQFEEAIEEAKAEKNLSRANIVRKVKSEKRDDRAKVATELAAAGHTTDQIAKRLGYSHDGMREFLKRNSITVPADNVVRRSRRLDSERIVRATVEAVDGIGVLLDQIDYTALAADDVNGWLPILDSSIRSLTTLRNELRKVSQP